MIEQLVRILVDAGASHASAARAAVILERGGSIREASAELDLLFEPLAFDGELLLFESLLEQIGRERAVIV